MALRALRAVRSGSGVCGAETVNVGRFVMTVRERGGRAEVCGGCFGTGIEVVPWYCDLKSGEERGGARRCGCRRAGAEALVAAAQIPERYAECAFSNYHDTGEMTQFVAFGAASKFVDRYPDVGRGLMLMGPCGVGKTHLMAAVMKGLCAKGVRCLFQEFEPLLLKIKATYRAQARGAGEGEADLLSPLYNAEVLLLDELGTSQPTDWAVNIFGAVIEERYRRKKVTLATTNCHDPDDGPGWGFPPLEVRVGRRARSRLFQMCATMVVEGEDYRKKISVG